MMRHNILSLVVVSFSSIAWGFQCQTYLASGRLNISTQAITFAVTSEPQTGDVLTVGIGQGKEHKTIYRDSAGDYVYLAPLDGSSSSFVVVWGGGSGYRTKILAVVSQPGSAAIAEKLSVMGRGFPYILRAGTQETEFVLIPNSSLTAGSVINVVDIYALSRGVYRFELRAPSDTALLAVQKLAAKFDQAAARQQGGIVVHP